MESLTEQRKTVYKAFQHKCKNTRVKQTIQYECEYLHKIERIEPKQKGLDVFVEKSNRHKHYHTT